MKQKKNTLSEFFRRSPLVDSGIDLARDSDTGRDIEFFQQKEKKLDLRIEHTKRYEPLK